MKKINTSTIVLIIVSVLFFFISFYEAYRITSVLEYNVIEILFTYETFIVQVYIILFVLYLVVLIKFSDTYDKTHYIIKRIYLLIHLFLATFGYLLGLNLEYLLGNKDAFHYLPFNGFWWFIPTTILILFINFYILNYQKNYRNKPIYLEIVHIILVILFALIFHLIVTDSTSVMGVFD